MFTCTGSVSTGCVAVCSFDGDAPDLTMDLVQATASGSSGWLLGSMVFTNLSMSHSK